MNRNLAMFRANFVLSPQTVKHAVIIGLLSASIPHAFAQPTVQILPRISGVVEGQNWGDLANQGITLPLSISSDGAYVAGFQARGCCDFEQSAGIRWRVSDGGIVNIALPSLDGDLSFIAFGSLTHDGSTYIQYGPDANYLVSNGSSVPLANFNPRISADGLRLLGLAGSHSLVQLRSDGTVIADVACPPNTECGFGQWGNFDARDMFSTSGNAFIAPRYYWRQFSGVVTACSLFPNSCTTARFTGMSGNGRLTFGAVSPTQSFVLELPGPVRILNEPSPTTSASENAEVRVLSDANSVVTPKYGVQTIMQFCASEGVNTDGLESLTVLLVSRDARTFAGYGLVNGSGDHVWVVRLPGEYLCDSIDYNNDGSFFDPQDIDALLSVFHEAACIPVNATCNDIDFNNDTNLFDPEDINAFLRVYSEGPCIE